MDHYLNILLTGALLVISTSAQVLDDDLGSLPPRHGAVPVRAQIRAQPRRFPVNSQLVSDPVPLQTTFKIRRPLGGRAGRLNGALPIPPRPSPLPPQPQQINEISIPPRPVIEDPEEQQFIDQQQNSFHESSLSPFSNSAAEPINQPPVQIRPTPRPSSPSPPAFRPERPPFIPTPAPEFDFPSPTRDFPAPTRQQQFRTTASPPQPSQAPVQQFTRQQQPSRQQLVQQQQVLRNQPQKQQQQFVKQQFQQDKERERPEPPPRARKPVAQVLRKYREDNEDGSITWGFENDDGSFKEETIGNDCVTRGKYGYIDPDGVRREYSYTSGILCDKKEDNQEAATTNEGYIDYQNNRYIFPNGDAIDLDKMVKNRARKPQQLYRN